MSKLKSLFKQTFIYGLATVLPRMLSFLLVPLYTTPGVLPSVAEYGKVSIVFSYFVLFNVILAYGMETAFFRFYNKSESKDTVVSTSTISLFTSTILFLIFGYLFKNSISNLINIETQYLDYVLWILVFDALVIVPFAWLRATEKPMKYAIIKISNVAINLVLNIFFLVYLKELAVKFSFFEHLYKPNFELNYIFLANLISSVFTFLMLGFFYLKLKFRFDFNLWKQMMRYAIPVLIAGIAFSINETFDRILLDKLLPESISNAEVGMYSACYKLSLFMTLFATAFRLGIEPFFFSHAKTENPQKGYALIMEYFVAFGALIFLGVVVFADILKPFIVRSSEYWEGMWVVPIILLANFCLGIYHNLSVWYKITDKTKFGANISIVGAVFCLILNFWLIPIMSYRGSAIATLVAYASMMILSFYYGQKNYPIPYNLKKIGTYLILSILFSMLVFYKFRANYWIGILFLILLLVIVYRFEKKQLQQIIGRKSF